MRVPNIQKLDQVYMHSGPIYSVDDIILKVYRDKIKMMKVTKSRLFSDYLLSYRKE